MNQKNYGILGAMSLSIGIVGLPNVGKSTLFNALTKSGAEASNYPFCTIDPNVGIVPVTDERLTELAKTVNTQKIVPAVVEFVDIAGIVAGASKGEGLGNKFLANIRECDAIAEVVRDFADTNVIHVAGTVDPEGDKETIATELILADLETMEKRVHALEKEARGNAKAKPEADFGKKVYELLEKGEPARDLKNLSEDEQVWLKSFQLLSGKPHLYIYNVAESEAVSKKDTEDMVFISAKVESELADFSDEEKSEYLKEIGLEEPGLNRLVKRAYELLGLQSFFTAGEKEAKAWTVKKGAKAPQAAGVIHTDFEKGFIKADVVNWKDLVDAGGWEKARSAGRVRLEGKDYVVQEGDVMIFKFSK
jgi:GTP-binding protein YchF